jgi:mannosyltransferase
MPYPKPEAGRLDRLFQRATPFLLLVIVALGGFLRVYQIGSKGLWLDEAFSVWLGWQPVGEMLGWLMRIDQHPPLYYALLHLWMALGDGAATVRALSALCGTLTIPVVYLLGRRLADGKVGLLAALILAVSPFHVRFAQETRP